MPSVVETMYKKVRGSVVDGVHSMKGKSSAGLPFRPNRLAALFGQTRRASRALLSSLVFFLRMAPMVPSRPIDWVTKAPVIEKLSYCTHSGHDEGEVYRPPSGGPHPGIVVSCGVVPRGVEHPQVPLLGQALARAGFAALMHWSPAMRDLRLDPAEIDDLAVAYQTLLDQPYIDPQRSGFMGICVGASFALMAAAGPCIRNRIAFISAYAPYASMWTLVRDIASATRTLDDTREHWQVDPLTWKTYVRTLTCMLQPCEAQRLRDAFEDQIAWNASKTVIIRSPHRGHLDPRELSAEGQAVFRLLHATERDDVETALRQLPPDFQARLTALSPLEYLNGIAAPIIVLLHDRYDSVIPVGESRQLWSALSGRSGTGYTEMGFRHLRPTGLSPLRLVREISRFYRAMYPIFRRAMA